MYINDVHILYYIIVAIGGIIIGQFIDWIVKRSEEEKTVFSKDIIAEYRKDFKPNFILMTIVPIIYIFVLYFYGIRSGGILENLNVIKYILIVPILISIFIIDYKHQIIPNRLNLTLFELGLVFTLLFGFNNVMIAADMLLGLLAGGGIFLLITLVGGLIAGKEAMGFGDVKLMCGLGLLFGFTKIIIITLLSFLIGAIISIILLISKKKKKNEYIPFGPFIILSTLIVIFVPSNILVNILVNIFTLGMIN